MSDSRSATASHSAPLQTPLLGRPERPSARSHHDGNPPTARPEAAPHSFCGGDLRLRPRAANSGRCVAYAATYVYATRFDYGRASPDEQAVRVLAREGRNLLLIKVGNVNPDGEMGQWRFYARILDALGAAAPVEVSPVKR